MLMSFCTKKYLGLSIFLFLLGGFMEVKAQATVSSPKITCVSVDSVGDITVTWTLPPNMNGTWQNFTIDTSTTHMPGSYGPIAVITNPTQTSITIPFTSFPVSANSTSVDFFIITNTTKGSPPNSDTASSIFLSVFNASSIAELRWNISTPLPPTSIGWFKIYREFPAYVWTFVDSVKSRGLAMQYNDTNTICGPVNLTYRIEIADSSGCISTSNRSTANGFNDVSILPAPIMDSTSVTSSNTVDITWSASPKKNVRGYIVYKPRGAGWVPIDTIGKGCTVKGINSIFYNYVGMNPDSASLSFAVAAIDTCGNAGPLSNQQNTIYVTAKPNSCEQTNTLTWNPYGDFNNAGDKSSVGVGGYKIYVSVNSSPYKLLGSTANGITTYTDSNLSKPQLRCYYVQVYDSLHPDTTASSNIVCSQIQPPTQPIHNYLRTATVIFNTNEINVVGYVDSLSGAEYYEFQRALDTGSYTTIAIIKDTHHTDSINYIDNAVTPTSQTYRYQIILLDACSKSMDTTNIGQTMLLKAVGHPDRINTITWNNYANWLAGPSYYLIYRSEDGVNYALIDTSHYSKLADSLVYTDNVMNILTGQGFFYYYIKAVEGPNGVYPFIDTSLSNIAIAYQDPTVYVPDAFCPDGVNKIFKPVGRFVDLQGYDLSILNRWGVLVFESNEPTVGWDGTYKGGKQAEEGAYVYILTYTSSKGQYFQKKGSVTLLR